MSEAAPALLGEARPGLLPSHRIHFTACILSLTVKVLIWKVVIVIPRAFREGGQNYGVLVFQKATLIPTAQVKDGGSGTAWRS